MDEPIDGSVAEILSDRDIQQGQSLDRRILSAEDLSKGKHGNPHKFLVNISVVDSTGPLKMVVDSNSTVEQVMKRALQEYEHEGRLPAIGTDTRHFELYSANDISEALDAKGHIEDANVRDFILHWRQNMENEHVSEEEEQPNSWRSRLLRTVAAHFNYHQAPSAK